MAFPSMRSPTTVPVGMGFDVVEVLGRMSRTGTGPAHQFDLGMTGRRRDVTSLSQTGAAVGGPGRVDRGRLDYGVDAVARLFRRPSAA